LREVQQAVAPHRPLAGGPRRRRDGRVRHQRHPKPLSLRHQRCRVRMGNLCGLRRLPRARTRLPPALAAQRRAISKGKEFVEMKVHYQLSAVPALDSTRGRTLSGAAVAVLVLAFAIWPAAAMASTHAAQHSSAVTANSQTYTDPAGDS